MPSASTPSARSKNKGADSTNPPSTQSSTLLHFFEKQTSTSASSSIFSSKRLRRDPIRYGDVDINDDKGKIGQQLSGRLGKTADDAVIVVDSEDEEQEESEKSTEMEMEMEMMMKARIATAPITTGDSSTRPIPSRSRSRSNDDMKDGLQQNHLLAQHLSPSRRSSNSSLSAKADIASRQPIGPTNGTIDLTGDGEGNWAEDQEEGMGMDDPDEEQLAEELGAFEMGSEDDNGSKLRSDVKSCPRLNTRMEGAKNGRGEKDTMISIDEDSGSESLEESGIDALNPTTSGKKRKGNGSRIRNEFEEDGDDAESDTDDPSTADACPVCGKTFVALSDDKKRMHVNTCLDSTWSRSAPCEPEESDSEFKPEEVDLLNTASASTSEITTTFVPLEHVPAVSTNKKGQQPISSYCIPVLQRQRDNSDEDANQKFETAAKGANAFSVLMSSHKEDAQWKLAEIDLKRDGKRTVGRRKAPFYKVLTGMPIAVDAFRYGSIPGVKAYFLTHAHSDHYTNLSGSWKNGPIYCSETTANLIKLMLGVKPEYVHGLPWDKPYELPGTNGVQVTVIKANHCPGSSLFLFEGRQTVNAGDSDIKSSYVGSPRVWRYLHCGDFRACPKHVLHPAIAQKKIDTCYLDTTYLNPQYCFPPQPLVIEACADLVRRTVLGVKAPLHSGSDVKTEVGVGEDEDVKPYLAGQTDANIDDRGRELLANWLVNDDEQVKAEGGEEKPTPRKRTLVVMGTYSIGKERIVKGVARALDSKIYCDPRKRSILMCQIDPELHSMLTEDPVEASVHLVPLQTIQRDHLEPYLHKLKDHFGRILALRPTGWTYSPPAGTDMLPDVNTVIRRDQKRTFTSAYLRPMRGSSEKFMMFGVPYSEHSSFFELTCFALSIPGPDVKMIATVNVGNERSRGKMRKWFEKWQAEKTKRARAGLPAVVPYRDETFW